MKTLLAANVPSKVAAGGSLGGKGDPLDWDRLCSTGDPGVAHARTSCVMEQNEYSR